MSQLSKGQKQDKANTNLPFGQKLINRESSNNKNSNNEDNTPKLFDSYFDSNKLINSTLLNSIYNPPDLRKENEPNGTEENKNCNKTEKRIEIKKMKTKKTKKAKKAKNKKSQKIKKIKKLKEEKKKEEKIFARFSKKFKPIKRHKKNKLQLKSSPNEIQPDESVVYTLNNTPYSDVEEFNYLEDFQMHNRNNQDEIDIEKNFYDFSFNHCRDQILNGANALPDQNNIQYNQN